MPSKPDLTAAVMLAALLLRAYAAPFGDASTNGPEVGRPSNKLMVGFELVLAETARHRKEFKEVIRYPAYENLALYTIPTLNLEYCHISNSTKEAWFHLLLRCLRVYMVLLKLVEREYPGSSIPTNASKYIDLLIIEVENKMRNPKQVTALTSSEEEQLLRYFDNLDEFHREMTVHSILYRLHHFLNDGRRVINKKEKPRRSPANRS